MNIRGVWGRETACHPRFHTQTHTWNDSSTSVLLPPHFSQSPCFTMFVDPLNLARSVCQVFFFFVISMPHYGQEIMMWEKKKLCAIFCPGLLLFFKFIFIAYFSNTSTHLSPVLCSVSASVWIWVSRQSDCRLVMHLYKIC